MIVFLLIRAAFFRCRVVQKALEALEESDLPTLLKEFHNNVLSCIHDQNGNHVIQKCIEVMSKKSKKSREDGDSVKSDFFSEQIDFIVDDVLGNVASLSCHPYGCRVLQRILEHCVEPKKSRALDEISLCHKTLLDDQYGNYVIQHVLQFGRHSDRDSVLGIVCANGLLQLSKQKFASNVVEKLLKYGTAQQRKAVVREMLKVSVITQICSSIIVISNVQQLTHPFSCRSLSTNVLERSYPTALASYYSWCVMHTPTMLSKLH